MKKILLSLTPLLLMVYVFCSSDGTKPDGGSTTTTVKKESRNPCEQRPMPEFNQEKKGNAERRGLSWDNCEADFRPSKRDADRSKEWSTQTIGVRCAADKAMDGMIEVPGGTFTMGNNNGKLDEKPEHEVEVTTFFLNKTEVSVRMFKKYVDDKNVKTYAESNGSYVWIDRTELNIAPNISWKSPSYIKNYTLSEIGDYPVVHITQGEAKGYCEAMGKRLPTAAEWEYAAKKSGAKYSANGVNHFYYNGEMKDKMLEFLFADDGLIHGTLPVESLEADSMGFYHLLGNVWEWTSDAYEPY